MKTSALRLVIVGTLLAGSVGCNLVPPQEQAFIPTKEQQAMLDRLREMGPYVRPAGEIVQQFCQDEWPGNNRMQAHCRETQHAAHLALTQRSMHTSAERHIRSTCQEEWPENYQMQQHCETQQLRAWRHPGR